MATEAVASDHTSTDEQFEKKVNEEAVGQKSVSSSSENEGKHGKAEDEKSEGYEKNAELAAVFEVQKSGDTPASEASAEDSLKQEKVEDAQGPSAPFSKTEGEAHGDEKKPEPAVVAVVESSPSSEASVADNLKEEENEKELIPDTQTISVIEPAPDAAKSQLEEPPPTERTESTETEEEKQPKAADIPEALVGTVEKSSNTPEANPPIESKAEVVKETENLETISPEAEKPEPVVTEVQQKSEEQEKESQDEAYEAEQPNPVVIPETSGETSEKSADAIEKPDLVDTEVQEKSEEPEKESQEKPQEEEQPNTAAVPDLSAETNEKPRDTIEEKTREPELDAELLKETNKYEAGPQETEKTEPAKAEKEEQRETIIHDTEVASAEKPGDVVEVHPPHESDIEAVKGTGNSSTKSEAEPVKAEPVKAEKTELVSTEVEEKAGEQLEIAEAVRKTGENEESLSLNEKKTNKEVETSIPAGKNAQVSLNEEAPATPANPVESSPPAIAEKAVEEDAKKDEIQGLSKEVVSVLKNPEQASINQKAKTDLKEEGEFSAPTSVEENVAVNDVVEGSTREAQVEINKVEEQTVPKTDTTEAGGVKVEGAKDERPEVDKEKEGQAGTKVGEITTAASEHVRETLASKLEEKEEESIRTGVENLEKAQTEDPVKTQIQIPEPTAKESDATKTSKDLPREIPAKPVQKQSNNLLSKVKHSLVKAKKAITGKSPTSKTLSSEAKGDIKVK